MLSWKVAAVQMDCHFGNRAHNLEGVRTGLREAAAHGARLVVFPECALTGYAFDSKDEAWPHAEAIPGPSTDALAADCRQLGVWAVVGSLERVERTKDLFNVAILVGPDGLVAVYRKLHLPLLGVDRFTTPGDRPFAVHDLGGLRVGMTICYDGSFPESARALMLLGADLVVLPTNWPTGAVSTVKYLIQARALENHIYYAAVNRAGEERGFRFIGQSRLVDVNGELLAASTSDRPEILYADIDPQRAREKHIVKIPGKYELHRTADRRPEMYGVLCESRAKNS
ncbi:MAG TPA: carbon-nitrogen hydrolase family protein [Gemmataceae bacterium]|nr:carbon-nitrogen hydrolase family protein [Gemmataceae bacterium]